MSAFPVALTVLLAAPLLANAEASEARQTDQAVVELTLDGAVELALKQNAALRVWAAEVEAARERATAAGKPPPVELSLSLTSIIEKLEWVVGKLLGFIGKRKYESRAARAEHAALLAGNAEFVLELTAAVKAAYWSLALADREIEACKVDVKQARRLVEATRRLVEAGAAPAIDLQRAEAELMAAEQGLATAKRRRQEANAALAVLVGERPDRRLEPVEEPRIQEVAVAARGRLYSLALAKRPAIRRLEALIEAARQGVKIARAERIPQIFLGAIRDEGLRYGFLELSFPLIDLGSIRHSVRAAKWTEQAVRAELESVRQEIRAEVDMAITRLAAARERLESITRRRLPRQQAILDRLLAGYRARAVTALEVIDAQRQVNELRHEQIEAWEAYYAALAGLERAVGAELSQLEGAVNEADVRQ